MFYKCIHFGIKELVDQKTFEKFGEESWMFFHPNVLMSLDNIRTYFGKPTIVNNWAFGGSMQNRGLRTSESTVGTDYSQHRFGNAFDIDINETPAEEVRQRIIKLKDSSMFYMINCLETNVNWVHLDCRNCSDRIRLVTQ